MNAHTDSLTETIVRSLSDVKGVDPLELPPLYEAVDADALERLFSRDSDSLEVTFRVSGCEVTVRGREDVTVTPVADQVSPTLRTEAENDATVQTGQD